MFTSRSKVWCCSFIFLSWFVVRAYAQTQPAGLLARLKQARENANFASDTASVTLLNQLAYQYLYNQADSTLSYAKEALKLSLAQKFRLGEARSWQNTARAYYVMGDYDRAMAAVTHLTALGRQLNDTTAMAGSHQITGLIYLTQNKFAEGDEELNQALDLFLKQKNDAQVGKIYFNLAISNDDRGNYGKAFEFIEKAIAIANRLKDNSLIPMAYNRAGEIYYHLKAFSQAKANYNRVIDFKQSPKWELDFAWSGIAQCWLATADYRQAAEAAKKSYDLALEVNSSFDEARALQTLAAAHAALNDYKDAYNEQVIYKRLNDSLFNSDKDKEINSLHLKQQRVDNHRLQSELTAKEQELTLRKRLVFFRNLIAIATVIFIIFIILSNRQKTVLNKVLKKQNEDISNQKEEISQQKEILDQLNNTKNQLFSVISHDLRSPFAAIMQSIEAIRYGDITAEEQAELMEEFYRQVSLVTIMVNNLLAWANSQQQGIKSNPVRLDVTAEVENILPVSYFMAKNKDITLKHTTAGEKYIFADSDHLKIIIQNLVGNAIKFTGQHKKVEVYYTENESEVGVHIRDHGMGIQPDKLDKLFKITGKEISGHGTLNEGGAGIGLALVKQFVDANNGRLEVWSKLGEGSEFSIYLPKA
jgi:signal transduction histidine kinase